MSEDLNEKFVYTDDDYFVHESIIEFDETNDMLVQKSDKPYYIPPKKELLKYEDNLYFEKNNKYTSLVL